MESYSFAVEIFKNGDDKFSYGIFHEVNDELQLLESGEADTLIEAAETAGRSMKTLFLL